MSRNRSVLASHRRIAPTFILSGLMATVLAAGCSSSEGDDGAAGGTGNTSTAAGGNAASTGGNGVGGATGTGNSAAGGNSSAAPTVIEDDSVGKFAFLLNPTGAYTSMTAYVKDKATPQERIWTIASESGECKLLKPSAPFCDPACTGTTVCGASNTCEAMATNHGAGTLTVSGVKTEAGATQFTLDPNATGTYIIAESIAYPPFAPGDTVSIAAAGGEYSPFTVTATGIVPFATTMTSVPFSKTAATTLTWTAGTTDAKIHVEVDISHHGGNKGKIVCDAVDDGSLEIPAALVKTLIELGTAGFPKVNMARQSKGSATLAHGRVDLLLNSELVLEADVEGVISCNPADATVPACPTGMTCNSTALICQ